MECLQFTVTGITLIYRSWVLVILFLIYQIMLGRFPCCFEFCGCYGGSGYIFLSEQWMGYQYTYFRSVSEYSSSLLIHACTCFLYLYHKKSLDDEKQVMFLSLFLGGGFWGFFYFQVMVLLSKVGLMEFEASE